MNRLLQIARSLASRLRPEIGSDRNCGMLKITAQCQEVVDSCPSDASAFLPDLQRCYEVFARARRPESVAKVFGDRHRIQQLSKRLTDSSTESAIVTAELLLVLGQYANAAMVLEEKATTTNRDLRVHDTWFRARYYQKHGPPKRIEDIGYENKAFFCSKPFEDLWIYEGGVCNFCCGWWLIRSIGNIFEQDPEEIWRSEAAQEIRESILDGSFRFCSKKNCTFLREGLLPKRPSEEELRALVGRTHPKSLFLAYDPTCNLKCPSCRSDYIRVSQDARRRLDEMTESKVLPLARKASLMMVSGYGDALGSPTFRRLLKQVNKPDCPELKIDIWTNGLLLSPERWVLDFGHLDGMINAVNLSADAACAETYAKLRGGDFARFVEAAEFVGDLLAREVVCFYQLNFVVQARNFREMPEFVRLAHRVGALRISFQTFADLGSMDQSEYRKHAVQLPDHPEHQALLEVLTDPVLRDVSVVNDLEYLVQERLPPREWQFCSKEGCRGAHGGWRKKIYFDDPVLGPMWTGADWYPGFWEQNKSRKIIYEVGSVNPRRFHDEDGNLVAEC